MGSEEINGYTMMDRSQPRSFAHRHPRYNYAICFRRSHRSGGCPLPRWEIQTEPPQTPAATGARSLMPAPSSCLNVFRRASGGSGETLIPDGPPVAGRREVGVDKVALRLGGDRMLDRLTYGMELTLRSSALALLLGLRWVGLRNGAGRAGIPAPRWDLRLLSKVALDELFFATELVSAPFLSRRDGVRVGKEVSEALELYEARGWLNDPAGYHVRPPNLERIRLENFRSLWGDYRHLRYESEYEPQPGEPGRERWLGYTANRTAHARLMVHPGRPRPWLVCVPGYRMGHAAVDFTGFPARWLHQDLGLNVAIPVIPLHGPRRVGRRGGDGFFTGDFVDTVHAQAQAVWDIRRLISWLHAQGAPAVALYGVSLGGVYLLF